MTYQNRSFPQKRVKLEESLVVWDGVTTANGAPGFTSLIDASLIGLNDFISNQVTVIILGGPAGSPIFEKAGATAFNPLTGEITFAALTARVMAGTPYRLLNAGGPVDLTPVITVLSTVATTTDTLARNDGVYFDELLGAGGTAYPIGLPATPVSNLADALTIMTARNLKKLYLAGTGAHAITLTNGINIQIVGNAEYAVTIAAGAAVIINGDLLCKSFTNTTGTPTINGNLTSMTTISSTTGTITVWGNVYAGTTTTFTGAGGITVYGDAKLMGNVTTSNATATITIGGNAFFGAGYVGTSGALTINGDCLVTASLANAAATVIIYGNCFCGISLYTGAGSIEIRGNVHVGHQLYANGVGNMNIRGNTYAYSSILNSGSGYLRLFGNVFCEAGLEAISAFATIVIGGNVFFGANVITSNASAIITIGGNAFFGASYTGTSGALTVNGSLEVVVNLANAAATVIVGMGVEVKGNLTTTTENVTINGDTHVSGLVSTTTGHILIYGNLAVGTSIVVSGASGDLTVTGNVVTGSGGDITTQNATATIVILGDLHCGDGYIGTDGALTVGGNASFADDLENHAAAVIINGKCDTGDDLTTTTGAITINNDCHVGGKLDNTGSGDININGNLFVAETTIVSAAGGLLHVAGDATLIGAVGATNGTAVITIDGYARIFGALTQTGTVTIKFDTDYKDIWCTVQTNNVAIHAAAGVIDLDFPDVVVAAQGAARGLPLGVVPTEAYPLLMFTLLDDSGAANYLDAAKDIRVKVSTQGLWANGTVGFLSVAGDWYTLASGMREIVIIGALNVGAQLTPTGAGTYNFGSDQTENATALTCLASHLQMKDLKTGLRIYYRKQ